MSSEVVGITIGMAIKGIGELIKVDNCFDKLKLNLKQTHGSLKNFSRDLAKLKINENALSKIKLNKEALQGEFLSVTSMLARSATLVIPTKMAIDFEESMADVRKVVDFKNKVEMNAFGKNIMELSRTIPLSAKELATITASGGQLGIAKENLLEFTTIAAKMGVAFDMSADEAGDSMGKLMNIFKFNIKEVTKLGDAINHLSDNSASKANEVVAVLKRIGGTGKTIGLTAVQTAALASSFISLGKTPELAATSADTLMKRLGNIKEDTKTTDALSKLGLDTNYVKIGMKTDPQKMIISFLEKVKNIPKEEQLSVLTDIFGDGFSGDIALLVNGLDTYKKALKDTANEKDYLNSMEEEFKNKSDTTANALELFKNSIKEIGINIGSSFLPALATSAKGLATFVSKVVDLLNSVPGLTKALSFSIFGFLILKPAILAAKIVCLYFKTSVFLLNGAFLKLKIVIKSSILLTRRLLITQKIATFTTTIFTKATKLLSIAMAGVSKVFRVVALGIRALSVAIAANPIGLVLAVIGGVATYVIMNWDKVKVYLIRFLEWIKPVFEPVINAIKIVWEKLSIFFKPLIEGWKLTFKAFGDFISLIFADPVEAIKKLFEPLFKWFEDKFGWVSKTTLSVTGLGSKALDSIKGVGTSIKEGASGMLDGAMSFLGFGSDEQKDSNNNLISQSFDNRQTAPAYNFNFGDINPNVDVEALKKVVMYELDRQNRNARNRSIRD
ncbi:phage tail tape measure protein [Campylobacter blaseri]|uniref:Phage tail tape measure protein n=1 Tax=Campylobacter blaseri TaxID=2042961 RepID=A0A2P8QYQ4_9BACT|nr:phage tail tape measure protein [Campylobacter blaseri]PSM51373.1 phage tail tape measure protein [Campylobacter blaseri]PSM52823.1 phage tail tape measure protein [Campylobacter blaseri]QKF86124.1 phage tail tape measure protein [Campylobacter blaseri]